MAKIIYLNGPSSSGKTTLAKALQEAFLEPYLHIGFDKIIGFMPAKLNINPSPKQVTICASEATPNQSASVSARARPLLNSKASEED